MEQCLQNYRLKIKGLYLRVDLSGHKYLILRYWENNKEHQLSLGTYSELSLKDTRIKRDEIQTVRAKGESPTLRSARVQQQFSEVADEWLTVRMKDRDEDYLQTIRFRLNKYVLLLLDSWPLREITSGHILQRCRSIESTGHD